MCIVFFEKAYLMVDGKNFEKVFIHITKKENAEKISNDWYSFRYTQPVYHMNKDTEYRYETALYYLHQQILIAREIKRLAFVREKTQNYILQLLNGHYNSATVYWMLKLRETFNEDGLVVWRGIGELCFTSINDLRSLVENNHEFEYEINWLYEIVTGHRVLPANFAITDPKYNPKEEYSSSQLLVYLLHAAAAFVIQ